MGRKLNAGDPFGNLSAGEFNRHVDASDFVLSNLVYGNGTPRRGTPGDLAYVSVKNVSGALRRQGEILEFTDNALVDLSQRVIILKGGNPTFANAFGVLNSPVDDQEFIPDCQTVGNCVGLVNVIDVNHKFASPKKDSYVLQSCPAGPVRILWKPPAVTGEQTCALLLTGDSTTLVKPTANKSKGTTAQDCKVWLNGSDTGATLALIPLAADIKQDKYCVAWGGFVWPWECG